MNKFLNTISQITIGEDELDRPITGAPSLDENSVTQVLEVVFAVAGAIAMLVIVIAGIMFILSRGDPQKSATARNTIIYAGVGLAIAVAAFSIVQFVTDSV